MESLLLSQRMDMLHMESLFSLLQHITTIIVCMDVRREMQKGAA